MGFEEAIPPVPDRLQEVKGMERLQNNWLSQKYYKYYMNEAVRIPKMAFADRLNKVYSELFLKIFTTAIVTLPILYMSRRFFITRGGLPITKQYPSIHIELNKVLLLSLIIC